ncbi:MAG: FecR domain-containing protein [Pseudomonadota bacterium]
MTNTRHRYVALVWLVVTWLCASSAFAANSAAEVNRMRGEVTASSASGESRRLTPGASVYAGDLIATGTRSFVTLNFKDGSRYSLGQRAQFRVEKFVYERSDDEDGFVARVFKGAFRFISGKIAKKRRSAMTTRLGVVATIGVRGTSVGGEVDDSGAATVVLLEPEEAGAQTAIDVFNAHGAVTIDEPGFGTDIPDAQTPPSPPRRMRLRAIENLMRSLQQIGRIGTPRPRVMRR